MNRTEVLAVLSVLKAAYPNFYRGMDRRDAEAAVGLWCDVFREDDAAAVGLAVRAFIQEDQKGFPPAPGQIRSRLPKHGPKPLEGPLDGWKEQLALVQRHEKLVERRRAAGVPAAWDEAGSAGLKAAEWADLLNSRGLGVEAIL